MGKYLVAASFTIYIICRIGALEGPQIQNVSKSAVSNLQGSSSSCGGSLTDNAGTISYKNFQPYAPNERCVWTIRSKNATSYNVELETLGESGTLVITGLGIGKTIENVYPSRAGNISMSTSNVMVITFHTSNQNNTNNYRGFLLRYTSTVSGTNPKASVSSEDVIITSSSGHIKYPSNATTYGNFDLSVIVAIPQVVNANPVRATELVYVRRELEGQSCQDRLTVYAFSRVASYPWNEIGRMCGGVEYEFISRPDLIMLVFESDSSGVYAGFDLYPRYL